MVLHTFLRAAAAVSTLVAFALPVQAGESAGKPNDAPNVLVVKAPLDKNGVQQNQDAVMLPVKIDVPRDSKNDIDYDKLAKAIDDTVDSVTPVPLDVNQLDATQAPDGVRKIFDDADQAGPELNHHLNWRIWSRWGSANRGFYGYGYYPYWTYNTAYTYQPYYGYYDGYFAYPYSYGYYRPYSGYGWYYYVR